jgi:hypothetical protein
VHEGHAHGSRGNRWTAAGLWIGSRCRISRRLSGYRKRGESKHYQDQSETGKQRNLSQSATKTTKHWRYRHYVLLIESFNSKFALFSYSKKPPAGYTSGVNPTGGFSILCRNGEDYNHCIDENQ